MTDVLEKMVEAYFKALDVGAWNEVPMSKADKAECSKAMRAAVAALADWYDETPKSDENFRYTALIAACLRSLLQNE